MTRFTLLTPLLASGQMVAPALDPTMGVVLHGGPAGLVLDRHCSREAPGPVESGWPPDHAVITSVERALALALDAALKQNRNTSERSVNDYYRQYVGAVINGERIVYINGFYNPSHYFSEPGDWRTTAIMGVCDGGVDYFGAEYVPATDAIRNFRFDGSPMGRIPQPPSPPPSTPAR